MKSRIWVLLTAVALVIATTVVMTNAVTPPDYAADLSLSAANKAECPVCGTEQTWTVLTAESVLTDVAAGEHRHYYVKDSFTNNTKNAANHFLDMAGGTVCLHLGGSDDVMTIGSYININWSDAAATLNVFGGGKVVGTGSAYTQARRGTVISNESSFGVVNVYSGTLASELAGKPVLSYSQSENNKSGNITVFDGAVIQGAANSDAIEQNGGKVIIDGGTVNGRINLTSLQLTVGTKSWMKPVCTLEDGVINGIGTEVQPATVSGAAVYLSYASFTMNGGVINGGYTSACGGAIGTCVANNQKQIYIYGGTINGGYAGGVVKVGTENKEFGGGAIFIDGNSTTKLSTLVIDGDVTISGGETAKYGGNICISNSTVTMGSNVTVSGGKAYTGGNIRISGGKAVLTQAAGSVIKDGTATYTGGNISVSESQAYIKGTMENGSSKASAGNAVVAGSTGYVYVDGGTVSGGVAATYGGNFQLNNGRVVVCNGGKILNGKASAGTGGNIYSGGGLVRIESTGGTISGGQALGTSGNGGNIYMTWASNGTYLGTIDIQAGTVSGGYAQASGGNIYAISKTTLNIGGTVRNLISELPSGKTAHAKNGGNIFISGDGTVMTVSGTVDGGVASAMGGNIFLDTKSKATVTSAGTVKNGVAATSGGNVYVCGGSELDVQGTVISKEADLPSGKTAHAKNGGNIYANGSTSGLTKVTITGTVDGGVTTGHGGNIYFANGAQIDLNGVIKNGKTGTSSYGGNIYGEYAVTLNMTGGKILDGTARLAGNIWIKDSGSNFNMSGGEISGGTGTSGDGQNNVRMNTQAVMTMTGGVVYGTNGAAAGKGTAICLYVNGTLRLGGNAKVLRKDGVRQGLVQASASLPRVQILNDWTGEATVNVPSEAYGAALPEDTTIWKDGLTGRLYQAGSLVDGAFVKGGTIQGKLYADLTNKILLTAEDGVVYIPAGEAISADGKVTTVRDVAAAYATGKYRYMQVYGGIVKMNGDLTLNVNGKALSVEGKGKLYAFDTANDTFNASKCGKLTIDSKDVQLQGETEIGDKRYVALRTGNSHTYTMHRVEIKLLNVVLRPDVEKLSDVGYYYQATYNFDDAVKNAIDSYGVVVSKIDMPGSDFLQEAKGENGWTVMYGAPTVNTTVNSGLLSNIMSEDKTPEENAAAGEKIVYANPYLVVRTADDTMTVLLGDPKNAGKEDGTALSLKDVLMAADDYYKDDATVMAQLKGYYKQWASYGLELWKKDLPNIAA